MAATTRVRARVPFRLKLVTFGGLLALAPIALIGIRSMKITRDGMTTMTRELQVSIVGDLARTTESELRSAEDGLELVGRTLLDDAVPEDRAIAEALRTVSALEALDHVGVYGPDGALVDVMVEESVRAHALPRRLPEDLIREADRHGLALGRVLRSAEGVRLLTVVAVRKTGDVAAYAASDVSLGRVQARLERLSELRARGLDGQLYLVGRDGKYLSHPDLDRVARGTRARGNALLDAMLVAVDSVEEASGEIEVDGETRVATVVRVPGRPFWIVSEVVARKAYAAFYDVRRIVVLTTVLAALGALAAAFLVARRITMPIEVLARFASDLSKRRFDRRVTLTTRDELALLGDAMSDAARELEASEHKLREEVEIRRDLGRYLPGELVDKVVRREQDMALGGTRREISVLFADVVAFTPLTEQLPAEQVVSLLNELFTMLTEIVFRHGGTIDKFIGDCVMAVYGATSDDPDHARHALETAEDMIAFLETGAKGFQLRYGVELQLAIGVNSGEAVVGNIGSESRMEYTAIGDVVNVAARLESIARPQQILVSGTTRALAGTGFQFVDRGTRELPGRALPLEVFEVVP